MAEQLKTFEFSPEDLMIDLIEISKQLPPRLRATSGEPLDMKAAINRRIKSEHKQILSKMLEDKVSLSPYVTPSFVRYIVRVFNADYVQGMGDGEFPRFAYFLDLDDPDSMGIYDATRAFELERKAFKTFSSNNRRASRPDVKTESTWLNEYLSKFGIRPGLPNLR